MRSRPANELPDRFQSALIDVVLSFASRGESAFWDMQRMIAAFDKVKKVWGLHLGAHALKKVQRTKRIACALDKQDRRCQSTQNFVAQFRSVAHRAERITKTNQAVHFFF